MGIGIEMTTSAKALLAQKGYDPQYGARPLKRVIQSLVEDKFSQAILDGKISVGDIAVIDVKDGDIAIEAKGIKPKNKRRKAKEPDV